LKQSAGLLALAGILQAESSRQWLGDKPCQAGLKRPTFEHGSLPALQQAATV
jgi:hypothetical protein